MDVKDTIQHYSKTKIKVKEHEILSNITVKQQLK